MFVVVVERWNRKVGGGWIVGLFVCLFVFFFFFVSLLQQFVVVASGAMVEVVVAIVL